MENSVQKRWVLCLIGIVSAVIFFAASYSLDASSQPMQNILQKKPQAINNTSAYFQTTPSSSYKIVMFEAPWCLYCILFNQDVVPQFLNHPMANSLPLSRVDFHSEGSGGYALRHTIKTLPTVIIFAKGREIGRITGMTGVREFISLIGQLISDN